jgi:spore maturation protein CgeB
MDKPSSLKIVIFGLSITSSWGNGHATTYRGLIKALCKKGHNVLFLERDVPWYAMNRDLPDPPFGKTQLYSNLQELNKFISEIKDADMVIVGSYVPDGIEIGKLVIKNGGGLKAFYDIDTPITLSKLDKKNCGYLNPELVSLYDLYLSFSGGPILKKIEDRYNSPMARALYCSVDPEIYFPKQKEKKWDLGYLGTYSSDRQPKLNELLIKAAEKSDAGKFIVVGPSYPDNIQWPKNVERIIHLSPRLHNDFYNSQKFTLNITREDMIKAGYSPSVRLFEAAACGVPIISDYWEGLDQFLIPGEEIFVADSYLNTLNFIQNIPEQDRKIFSDKAMEKVLKDHTADRRADELINYYNEAVSIKVNN